MGRECHRRHRTTGIDYKTTAPPARGRVQSLVSCHWTRGQRDGKNLHYDPVRRRGAACCAPTRRLGSDVLAEPKLPKADVAGAPQLRGPSWDCTVVPNTTRGGGAVSQHDGHKRSEALARLGE